VVHAVRTDVFEGPIDLLLHLITRRRVDIYEVPLAAIARDYLAVVSAMDGLDLEAATGFLVVAATLLELKSNRLLPADEGGPEEGLLVEERDALLARLVECSTLRAAGTWLAARLDEGSRLWPRTAGLEPRYAGLAPDPLATTTLADVARAAAVALAPAPPAPALDTSHLERAVASVRDAIVTVAERLRAADEVGFRRLCAGAQGRAEVVARFLALLELFKNGAVELAQASRFGEIVARWTGEVSVEEVLAEAEDYAAPPGTVPA
jgi:segregation and condensation protein A